MIRSQVVIILLENKKKLDTAVPEFISIFIYLFHLIHDKLHNERTCVPRKVRRSPKLPGVRRSPEPFARSADVRVPETLISPAQSTCGKGELVFARS